MEEDEPPPDYESDDPGGTATVAAVLPSLIVELSNTSSSSSHVRNNANQVSSTGVGLGSEATPGQETSFVEWENYRNRMRENLRC